MVNKRVYDLRKDNFEATSAGRFRIRCGDVIRKELGYPRPRLNVHTDVENSWFR